MKGFSKLGIGLTVAFVVLLVALFAQFFFILWRRRALRRRTTSVQGNDHSNFSLASSKELFYFFSIERQARGETDGATYGPSMEGPSMESIIDAYKLRGNGIYGPSRVLCTIKEEERMDMESERSPSPSEKGTTKTVLGFDEEGAPEVTLTVDHDVEATPFWTPSTSPFYLTPATSPSREVKNGELTVGQAVV